MGQTDFTPMCRRDVTIWRDADKAGVDFQDATIAKLQVAGAASIRFVDPDRIPTDMSTRIRENKRHKFDVVDLIEAGISPEAIGEVAERACVAVAISMAEAGPRPLARPATASRPFPIDSLGDMLAGAARAIAAKVQCADAMAAQSVLAVASWRRRRWRTCNCPMARLDR